MSSGMRVRLVKYNSPTGAAIQSAKRRFSKAQCLHPSLVGEAVQRMRSTVHATVDPVDVDRYREYHDHPLESGAEAEHDGCFVADYVHAELPRHEDDEVQV